MFLITPELQFIVDYARFTRHHPELVKELQDVIEELASTGSVPDGYHPQVLSNPGGNYDGYVDFHLSEGTADVIVLALSQRTNPIIRLV